MTLPLEKPMGTSMIFVNDRNQILLVLRDDKPDIPYPNTWDIPGGHVEPRETPEECIAREIKEEMNLVLADFLLFRVTEFEDRTEHTFWLRKNLDLKEIELTEGQRLNWFSADEVAGMQLAFGFDEVVRGFFRELPSM